VEPFPRKKWSHQAWLQLKNINKREMLRLLDHDPNWSRIGSSGSRTCYRNPRLDKPFDVVAIHFHAGDETYRNPSLLKDLLDHICWTEDSLRVQKFIR